MTRRQRAKQARRILVWIAGQFSGTQVREFERGNPWLIDFAVITDRVPRSLRFLRGRP